MAVPETVMAKAGCFSHRQKEALLSIVEDICFDPSLMSDLEGAGPVRQLEEAFAESCGAKYALALSSGTAAIHAALLAAGIGHGDEVIVTPYSWPQSVSPVIFTGATPVFADIDPYTLNIDPAKVRAMISPRTKAIIAVHLFGHMADMRALEEISEQNGLVLIADAAHALGTSLDERPVGAWGDMACFSLGRGKLVSVGEGGILATDDRGIYEKAVLATQHPARMRRIGLSRELTLNLNYRLHPLICALAMPEIMRLEDKLAHRKRVHEAFWEGLDGERPLRRPRIRPGERQAYYGVPLLADSSIDRATLCALAMDEGIPLAMGPVGTPLNIAVKEAGLDSSQRHTSHEAGACPVAEDNCALRELWAINPLDMDAIMPHKAFSFGESLKGVVRGL